MDVGRLRVLRELADRGSVTAVAAALSFTPSAISQQLRALTAEVGVPLTEPAGRGLRLTAAGQALVTQSEEVFTALARAQAAVDGLRSLPGRREPQPAARWLGERHPDLRGQRPQLLGDRRRRERQRSGDRRHRSPVRQLAENPQPPHIHEATLQRP